MTSQYGAYALHAGLSRLHALTRMHTPTRPVTHMRTRTLKHAHTDQYAILIAFPQQRFAIASQCYVIRTLPVLYLFSVTTVISFSALSVNLLKRYPLHGALRTALSL
jgi:hypothetical protein